MDNETVYIITHNHKGFAAHKHHCNNISEVIDYLADTCHVMLAKHADETGLQLSLLKLHPNQSLICENEHTQTPVYVKKTTRKQLSSELSYTY